jgi:hypothetical protein
MAWKAPVTCRVFPSASAPQDLPALAWLAEDLHHFLHPPHLYPFAPHSGPHILKYLKTSYSHLSTTIRPFDLILLHVKHYMALLSFHLAESKIQHQCALSPIPTFHPPANDTGSIFAPKNPLP